MDYRLLVDTAVLAGEIMLKSGAETYRVEDTIARILKTSGLERTEAFVTSTGIMVSLTKKGSEVITLVTRVNERNSDLNRIYLANQISRKLCQNQITLQDAYDELKKIENKQEFSHFVIYLSVIITAAFFTVRIGGNFSEFIFSAVNGCIIVGCDMLSHKIKLNYLVNILFATLLIAFTTMVFYNFYRGAINMERIISSSIMPLVPGVAITNAVRDTLQGDYLSGGARIIEAFVIAAIIAMGIGGGFLLGNVVFGGGGL